MPLRTDSDYAIFAWRQQESAQALYGPPMELDVEPIASSSKAIETRSCHSTQPPQFKTPTLHLHNPKSPLPAPPEYCNPSYYIFRSHAQYADVQSRRGSVRSPVPSSKSKKGKVVGLEDDSSEDDGVPRFKKQFNRFHEENGVRTVIGSIGSAQNGSAKFNFSLVYRS
jgi:hypothetical protein